MPLNLKISESPPQTTLFESLPPQGLTMTPRPEKDPVTKPSERARGRVLLIAADKHPQFVDTLSERGVDVFGVPNGAAAMVSMTRTRPHLVVAHAAARGLRIKELAKMLAQSEDGIPLIIAGSEPSSVALRLGAIVEGAFDYFTLPAELDLLIERTQQLVLLRQKIDQLRAERIWIRLRVWPTGVASGSRLRVRLNAGAVIVCRARC